MIDAMIFDLDGTLLQTELLKAKSYARAAVELCPYTITENAVLEAFKDFVGLSRREVALGLMQRFDLEAKARARMDEFKVSSPWQAYIQVRLKYYDKLISDPDVLRTHQWTHNVALLDYARQQGYKTGLATMSECVSVQYILDTLGWRDKFDFIATHDDIHQPKPNPEIYLLVAADLGVSTDNALVIEDSEVGVQAAINAGIRVIAVSTPFTQQALHESHILDEKWIVDDPSTLMEVVAKRIA